MTVVVRRARDSDQPAILELVAEAFAGPGSDAREELEVVEKTWARGHSGGLIELVALDDDAAIGHVMAAAGTFTNGEGALGVAPLCVRPARQGQGVGSELMLALIEEARGLGWSLVVLLGAPEYYRRFGFGPAADLGIYYEPVGPGDPHFMALRLEQSAPALDAWSGPFTYCWE